jgi:hypothetical protein
MTSTTTNDGWAPGAHPVVAFLEQVHEGLDKLVDSPIWALSPDDLKRALLLATKAESRLLELAKVHDAKALTVLGRRILDVVAPEVSEAQEARVLDAEERAAEEDVRLTVREDERGRLVGRFATLLTALGSARLDTGQHISPVLARMAACEAGILPVVMGGKSQVLDVGRKRRFHTKAMRIALVVQQGRCTEENCDHPPGLSQVHHDDVTWADGGGTSAKKGRLLCPHHHRRAHDPAYVMTKLPHDKVRFTRRN